MSLSVRIMAAAVLQALALVGLVARENQARDAGREVLLPMEAVDPRNLLTGHYVALNLTQAVAPGGTCPPGTAWNHGGPRRSGWVALGVDGRVRGAGDSRASAQAYGPVVLKGRARCFVSPRGEGGQTTLDIGVSRFHLPQAKAEAMEKALRNRAVGAEPAHAVVSVGQDGKARLKGVIVGGVRSHLGWR